MLKPAIYLYVEKFDHTDTIMLLYNKGQLYIQLLLEEHYL